LDIVNYWYALERKLYEKPPKNVSIENGVGPKAIFGLVWLSIEILYLSRELLYITADIHGVRHVGLICTVPVYSHTNYTVNVRWWQHYQTKLPMAMMSANLYSLVTDI
jgi:hypothetical protein